MKKITLFIALVAMSVMSYALNPFAYGLSSQLSEDGAVLTVNYSLNAEATAVSVAILDGEEVVKSEDCSGLGLAAGAYTAEIVLADLPAGSYTWQVVVEGTSVAEPTEHAVNYSLYHPSSVDIDNNPENPTFGLVLTNEAMQSVASKTEGYISAGFGAGIYAFNPAFEPIANGDKPGFNGGKTFSTAKNDFAPRRVRFTEDGRIFATAQDGSGEYLWEINPANLDEWTTVFQGTNDGYALKDAEGNFIAGTNSGFDVRGEGESLQLLMLSASLPGGQVAKFQCHTYDLGTATTWATVPTKEIPGANYMLVTNQSNVQFDKDGGVWYIQYRGTTTETEPGLVHINKDGVEDYKELRNMTRNAGFRFNDDFTKVVIAGNNGSAKKGTVYAYSEDADGKPVLTEELVINMATVGSNLNDFAWDYAGNLYCCGNSSEKIVAWAMPYSGQVVTPAAAQYKFELAGSSEEEVVYEAFEMSNLSVTPMGAFELLEASDDMMGLSVVLGYVLADGSLMEGSAVDFNGQDLPILEGTITKSYSEDLATDVYVARLIVEFMGGKLGLEITMYAGATAEPVEVVISDATAEVIETTGTLQFTATWSDGVETYPVRVTVAGYEDAEFKEYEGAQISELQIGGDGDNDPWLDFAVADAVAVFKDGNLISLEGEYTSWATGTTYYVLIDGTLQGGEESAVEVMELTMTNLSVQNYGDATGLWASDMDNGIEVMLFLDADGNLMEESSIMVGWMDYPVTGTVTKSYNEELATDVYVAELYTTVGETNYKLIITMYYVPVEATPVVVENATIDDQTETSGFMYMYGEWTDADGLVYPVSAEVPGFDATVAEAVYSNVTVTVGGWEDDDPWLGFVQGDATITVVDDVVTLVGTMSSWDGLVLDVTISGTLPAVVEPVEMVGVVKRTLFNGNDVIVLTHEEDGTAHIYNIVEGDVLEVSQEGVIAVDPENAGDFLAISDIALTEDGKLVAINYMITQSDDTRVDAGYKRGETRIYIWDDLAGAPSILFTSKMSSNWFRSKQGLTMAVKGTSDNMEIFTTGIHATSAWARVSSYRVIDGVYVEPEVNHNDHYYFYDINDAIALETTVGTQYELNASPLGEMNWILDANLIDPVEIVEPETNNVEISSCVALNEDLGKKYNGASYITVGEQVYMVAPFATPDGVLTSVEVLDITNGLDAAQYVDQLFIEEPVAATAAATAVTVVENTLVIALVADATHYMLELPLGNEPGGNYEVYEDEITNLVIDYDNMLLIGGPSTSFQVEVVLGLGDYDRNTDTYQLLPGSSISVLGAEATFIDGYASVDGIEQTALAVVHCTWNNMALEFHLTMSAAPLEATKVVVENATVEIEKYLLFGDMYDYALKMTGVWTNEGVDYPVLVEVPVYYPEATEPSIIYSTVTVGGMGDDDPWLGFGEGDLTITTVGNTVTATGIVENPYAGIAIDITISGTIIPTGVENTTVTVKAVKSIKNGQLIIIKDGKEFNVQGAIVK